MTNDDKDKVYDAANKVSDEINNRGLEFGGRHEDVVTVLKLAVELGLLRLPTA